LFLILWRFVEFFFGVTQSVGTNSFCSTGSLWNRPCLSVNRPCKRSFSQMCEPSFPLAREIENLNIGAETDCEQIQKKRKTTESELSFKTIRVLFKDRLKTFSMWNFDLKELWNFCYHNFPDSRSFLSLKEFSFVFHFGQRTFPLRNNDQLKELQENDLVELKILLV